MKTKTDVLKSWKRTYNTREKAINEKDKQTESHYTFMLIAYEDVLEMSRFAIKKKLNI